MNKNKFKVISNVSLKNKFNNDIVKCDIINEDVIEGKLYFVVRQNNRVVKYAKDSYSLVRKQ